MSKADFRARMDAIAASQLNQTLARLAPGISSDTCKFMCQDSQFMGLQ